MLELSFFLKTVQTTRSLYQLSYSNLFRPKGLLDLGLFRRFLSRHLYCLSNTLVGAWPEHVPLPYEEITKHYGYGSSLRCSQSNGHYKIGHAFSPELVGNQTIDRTRAYKDSRSLSAEIEKTDAPTDQIKDARKKNEDEKFNIRTTTM